MRRAGRRAARAPGRTSRTSRAGTGGQAVWQGHRDPMPTPGSRPLCHRLVESGRPSLSKRLIWHVTCCSAAALAPPGPTVLPGLPCGACPPSGQHPAPTGPALRSSRSLHMPRAHECHMEPLQGLFPLPDPPLPRSLPHSLPPLNSCVLPQGLSLPLSRPCLLRTRRGPDTRDAQRGTPLRRPQSWERRALLPTAPASSLLGYS